MDKRKGYTLFFDNVKIWTTSSICGPKEGKGPLADYFDNVLKDDELGQKTYEKSETLMHTYAIKHLLYKTNQTPQDIDCLLGGDLLDEIVGTSFTAREFEIPYMGLYNACATFGEALIIGASLIEGGLMNKVICSSSSHFSTAERQFRFPLELGSPRPPLSQWTVTGAGATLLNNKKGKVKVNSATIGRVVDYGVKDANDMGAVMAPSAKETLITHLNDTKRDLDYYDLIVTGDLGEAGSKMFKILLEQKGITLQKNYADCGILIFNKNQNIVQGGSGAGCSNIVFNGFIFKKMLEGVYKKVLLMPTGALLSKISTLQGETIPSITHAISLEME